MQRQSARIPVPGAEERMSHSIWLLCNYDIYIIRD